MNVSKIGNQDNRVNFGATFFVPKYNGRHKFRGYREFDELAVPYSFCKITHNGLIGYLFALEHPDAATLESLKDTALQKACQPHSIRPDINYRHILTAHVHSTFSNIKTLSLTQTRELLKAIQGVKVK